MAPSPWDLGARNVGGVALAALALWPERTQAWLALAGYLVASRWLAAGLLVACAGLIASLFLLPTTRPQRYVPALILAAWGTGFLALHVITTVQVWDRYLLPLVLPLVLVIGACAARAAEVAALLAPGRSPNSAPDVPAPRVDRLPRRWPFVTLNGSTAILSAPPSPVKGLKVTDEAPWL